LQCFVGHSIVRWSCVLRVGQYIAQYYGQQNTGQWDRSSLRTSFLSDPNLMCIRPCPFTLVIKQWDRSSPLSQV
jgi:hypothetical protein